MKAKLFAVTTAILILLLVSTVVLGMSSPNYLLDWFVQLSGAAGGPSTSSAYSVNYTLGQVAAGRSASANYAAGLGYWYGTDTPHKVFLPAVLK
jgi:hypothetical protein